jgi:hypothetical protein
VKDGLLNPDNRLPYSDSTCRIMVDGKPPPMCGDWWLSIHEGNVQSICTETLDEYYAFNLTLTKRVTVDPYVFGEHVVAVKMARQLAQQTDANHLGFNARRDQLRAFFHGNESVIARANQYLVQWATGEEVYGFCEPPRFQGYSASLMRGAEWLGAVPPSGEGAVEAALVCQIGFGKCRRFQAFGVYQ